MRTPIFILSSMLLLAPSPSAKANDVPVVDVKRCALIEEPSRRLECYDTLARGLSIESRAPALPEPQPVRQAGAARARITLPSDQERLAIEQTFGLKNDSSPSLSTLGTTIDGAFSGWRGGTTFKLANGQVWRQQGVSRYTHPAISNPEVTITKLVKRDAYKMKVKGVISTVAVIRIQ